MRQCIERSAAAILIVDDQKSNILLIDHVLRRGGYEATSSTTNPAEVCALHRQNRYDLIILDLQMPDMDGFDVMKALESFEVCDRPAILVMSADPSQSVAALEAGATSFLSKPYALTDVIERVHELLEPAAAPLAA